MAQTGYTPILIYSSSTTTNAPTAGSLINSTLGSELAINITDGKLFYKDNANAVQVIAWKTTPTTAGGTGLTSYTAGDLLYYASGTTLTQLAIGASGRWLGSSGTAPQWNAPAALTKTDDTNVTLTLGGSASTALLNAASLTLGWTGQLSVTRGGTGLSSVAQGDLLYGSAANTLSALTKNTTATRYLSNTGTSNNPAWAQVDLSNGVTGTLPVGNGGTGLTSYTANRVLYASATNTIGTSANFTYDGTNLSLTSGNFVVATSGKGIDFSATPGTGTSELFADYEEGTFTPAFDNLTVGNGTSQGRYTKIGRTVFVEVDFVWGSTTSASGTWYVNNLPFTTAATFLAYGSGNILDSGTENYTCLVSTNASNTLMRPLANNASATYLANTGVTATVPMTWTTNDAVRMTLVYTT